MDFFVFSIFYSILFLFSILYSTALEGGCGNTSTALTDYR